jgi:hydrogenase maturation protein HypF
VSALINLCTVSKFHAEAPMRLESIANTAIQDSYPFEISEIISFKPTIEAIVNDLKNKVARPVISSKFHNTVISVLLAVAEKIRTETGLTKVVLSGGSFQNAILLGKSEHLLTQKGFEVFTHSQVPSNDGGIALGQLTIVAKRRSLGLI